MRTDNPTKLMDKLATEYEYLKRCETLLQSIYSEMPPYGPATLPDKLRETIHDHFGFDDSE